MHTYIQIQANIIRICLYG